MNSDRWTARACLVAALTVLVGSMSVLVARTVDAWGRPGLHVGDAAPLFTLRDSSGKSLSLQSTRGKTVLLFFGSPRCPVTTDYAPRVARLAELYGHELSVVEINSNTGNPGSSEMTEVRTQATEQNYPVLLDESASVADAYGARMTPTFYLIDARGNLRYSGAFDDNRVAAQVKRHYVESAIRRLRDGRPLDTSSTQAFGCAIKQQQPK
jgi:peroxiredoxin